MSVTRLRNLQQKKTALAKANRRDLASILSAGKTESARIRVENIIREDINVELLEILELYCELLLARIGLLESRDCDPGLEEPIKSLIYSAHRSEVKELVTLRQMFAHKYGKQFENDALENREDKVNAKVIAKLSVQPPPPDLVTRYLREIARTYHVAWHPDGSDSDDDEDDEAGGGGGGSGVANTGGLGVPESEARLPDTPTSSSSHKGLLNVALPSPTSENPRPRLHVSRHTSIADPSRASDSRNQNHAGSMEAGTGKEGMGKKGTEGTEGVDDTSFDALMARFEKLKKSG